MVLSTFETAFQQFIQNIVNILPNLLSGTIFLLTAYLSIKLVLKAVSLSLNKLYEGEIIVSLGKTVVAIFLWFGAALVFLSIIGLGEIAASLGTATGFIALGVAFAVSDMLADVVAGFYLLRDSDFDQGYIIQTEDTEGEIREVGLRKSRLKLENGDIAVLSNSQIEKGWTHKT